MERRRATTNSRPGQAREYKSGEHGKAGAPKRGKTRWNSRSSSVPARPTLTGEEEWMGFMSAMCMWDFRDMRRDGRAGGSKRQQPCLSLCQTTQYTVPPCCAPLDQPPTEACGHGGGESWSWAAAKQSHRVIGRQVPQWVM
jgi:hypothetical protein